MQYLIHATLTTGHMGRHVRSGSADASIDAVAGMLDGILQGGRVAVPIGPDWVAYGANAGRNLMVTLACGETPVLTTAVCCQKKASGRLWRLMHDGPYILKTTPDRPPATPWIADRIEPGAVDHIDKMHMTGGWSRCLGWAWLEYDT